MFYRSFFIFLVFIFFNFQFIALGQSNKSDALDLHFTDYDIVQINTAEILQQISQSNSSDIRLQLLGWDLNLLHSGVIDSRHQTISFDGKNHIKQKKTTAQALHGFTSQGGRVSLTVNFDFIQGSIRTGMYTFYIEPVYHFEKGAKRDLFVLYNTKDIIPGKEKECGVKAEHFAPRGDQIIQNGERSSMGCYEIDYAIASDFLMFNFYGSISAVENHNIAVTNDMQTNYIDAFAHAIQFVIVQQFIVTSSGADPWSPTLAPDSLLYSFTPWGPTGFTATHDVASLWTKRDLTGNTIGIAWLSAICTNARYNVVENFSTNADSKRVLLAHELGHNFGAGHDASGSTTIMAPSVQNTNTWSETSVNAIQNHYQSRTCLATCVIGNPAISFNTSATTIAELGGTGTTGTCNEPFKTIFIPVSVNKTTSNQVTVNVSVAPGNTAQLNRDFVLVTNQLIFPSGLKSTQQIQIRIIDDAIEENDESFTLNLSIVGGTADPGNIMSHQITILDFDKVSVNCCTPGTEITYGTFNGSTPLIFWGEWEDSRNRVLYLPSQLSAAGLTAGYITSIQYYVQQKNSTQPYQNFRVGLANSSLTTLLSANWIDTEEVFIGTVNTVQGNWNEIVFNTPFYWNGTSSLYFQFCFDNNSYTFNDFIRFSNPVGGGSGRYIEALIQDFTSGCSLTTLNGNFVNYSNFSIQPQLKFKQIKAAQIETATTVATSSGLRSGEKVNFYSSNSKLIASVKNIGMTDINCISASIETSGSNKTPLSFGGGEYSDKTIKIDADYNALYEVTLYYTQAELNTFGLNASRLNMIKCQSSFSLASINNSVIMRPDSIISGFGPDNAFGYKGTFSGFSRFALTNRNLDVGNIINNGDLVLAESGKGIVIGNKSGNNYRLTVSNAGNINTSLFSQSDNGAILDKSDLLINTAGKSLILRSPNGTFCKVNISDTGVLRTSSTTLPAINVQVTTGDFFIQENGCALISKSPNGQCWRIYFNEEGQLRTVNTLCP